MTRLAIFATAIAVGLTACQKGQEQSQASDSTARNLTLAPAESTAQMRDVADQRATPPPATRNPTNRTNPPAPPPARPPAPPPMARLGVGTKVDIAATDTISSRTAKVGDAFTARVVDDVRTSITVRGKSYPFEASVDSLETIHKGRGVTSGDAAKVGAGAAAGAILGRVLGGNKKGTIIGGIVGGAAGAAVAHETKDSDIVLPAGAHIIIRLTKELAVAAS